MKPNPTLLILTLLLSILLSTCAGPTTPPQQKIDTKLPITKFEINELDSKIWKIYQDTKGNYWFGSNGVGVYQYDGKKLQLFSTKNGLIDNSIRGIQEDHNGLIYIETPSGVSQYDGTNFTTLELIQSPKNEWKLLPNDLWFNCNTNAKDVYRFDGNKLFELQLPKQDIENKLKIFESSSPYSPYAVYGIDKDKAGNIWFGTAEAGAFRFDGNSFLWVGEKELSRLNDGRVPAVRSILEDKDGYLWLSNFISKYKIEPNSNNYKKIKNPSSFEAIIKDRLPYFNSGLTDKNGDLWMTTYGGSVWKYDGNTLSSYEIKSNTTDILLVSIYEDRQGTLWLGTDNDGAYKYNGYTFEKFELNK